MRLKPDQGAGGEPAEVAVGQRRVRRDDDHDRALRSLRGRGIGRAPDAFPAERPADGDAEHEQVAAEVGLHQHTDRPGAVARRCPPRRGADPALPAERHRAGARANASLGDRPAPRTVQRGADVALADRAAPDRVQHVAVVGLAHHRVDRANLLHARLREQPADHRVRGAPDAQRAGEQDRRLELAQLVHLRHAKQLAEAVPDVDGGGDAVEKGVAGMRQDGGDAGTDGVADANRGLADANAGDVGDRVQGTRREGAGDDAEVAGAGGALGDEGPGHETAEEKHGERAPDTTHCDVLSASD